MGVAEYLLHNRCDLNAFGGRDTLGDTLGDTAYATSPLTAITTGMVDDLRVILHHGPLTLTASTPGILKLET